MIEQNESEVDNDMLLVSDYIYTSNLCQQILKPGACEPLQYQGLHNTFIINLYNHKQIIATSGWYNIDIDII